MKWEAISWPDRHRLIGSAQRPMWTRSILCMSRKNYRHVGDSELSIWLALLRFLMFEICVEDSVLKVKERYQIT